MITIPSVSANIQAGDQLVYQFDSSSPFTPTYPVASATSKVTNGYEATFTLNPDARLVHWCYGPWNVQTQTVTISYLND
jgi:broad specificity phosphatase PhoE